MWERQRRDELVQTGSLRHPRRHARFSPDRRADALAPARPEDALSGGPRDLLPVTRTASGAARSGAHEATWSHSHVESETRGVSTVPWPRSRPARGARRDPEILDAPLALSPAATAPHLPHRKHSAAETNTEKNGHSLRSSSREKLIKSRSIYPWTGREEVKKQSKNCEEIFQYYKRKTVYNFRSIISVLDEYKDI